MHENSRFRLRWISYCVPIHGKTKTTSSTIIQSYTWKGDGLQAQQKICKCWWVTWKSSFDILAIGYLAWLGMLFDISHPEISGDGWIPPCPCYGHIFCWTNGTMFAGESSLKYHQAPPGSIRETPHRTRSWHAADPCVSMPGRTFPGKFRCLMHYPGVHYGLSAPNNNLVVGG